MIRSSDITSTTDLRQNLREQLDRLKKTGRPLFITTNGETDAVVLSPDAFDDLVEKAELVDSLRTIDQSMDAYKSGRVQPIREAVQQIARELKLKPHLKPDK
jgi:prevent-host-death family protein